MSAITVANTQAKLANANAAEAMLNQAYSFAGKAGMSGEMRNAFMALADMLADHRSAAQESATAALVELRDDAKTNEDATRRQSMIRLLHTED